MATLKQINFYFRLFCVIGIILSCYALFVHLKKENPNYQAYCDISEHISCTKAFSSEYGKGFGIIGPIFGEDSKLNQSNGIAGIIFYLALIFMSFREQKSIIKLQTVFCIISNFMSLYLAYILYFVLYDLCIVCVGTYIVNAINLALSISKWNLVRTDKEKKKKYIKE